MTSSPLEFERSPQVELRVAGGVSAAAASRLTLRNSSRDPAEVWREGLLAYRVFAIAHAKDALLNATVVNDTVIRRTLDTAWQLFLPQFQQITGPMIAESYIRAFRQVRDDKVPATLIYALADEHANRVGKYFNDTSAEALTQGFNTYVNREVPKRAVLERVLDAFGLTPKQMSGYTSAEKLHSGKVNTASPLNVKAKLKEYVNRSIADRLDVFQRQESHNLDEQAQQVAWMYMQEQGSLPQNAKKMWLTAKDERVCKVCGPMNAKKVNIGEQFELPNGNKIYVPGAHVNCRCTVRLQINPFEVVGKAVDFDENEHRRSDDGRFTTKPKLKTADPRTLDEDTVRLLRETQQRDAIAAAKLQEMREALRIKRKSAVFKPMEAGVKLEPKEKVERLQSMKLKPQNQLSATPLQQKTVALQGAPLKSKVELKPKEREAIKLRAEQDIALKGLTAPATANPFVRHDVDIGQPVYRIGDTSEMDHEHADNRRAYFDEEDNEVWRGNRSRTIDQAIENIENLVYSEIDRVMDDFAEAGFDGVDEPEHIVLYDGDDEIYIARDYVERAVNAVAWGEYVDPDPDEPLPIYWTNRATYQVNPNKAQLTVGNLIGLLNLNPEFFEQTIYYSSSGNSEQTEKLDDRQGDERWKLWGALRVVEDIAPREEISRFPIRWVKLESDTDTEPYRPSGEPRDY